MSGDDQSADCRALNAQSAADDVERPDICPVSAVRFERVTEDAEQRGVRTCEQRSDGFYACRGSDYGTGRSLRIDEQCRAIERSGERIKPGPLLAAARCNGLRQGRSIGDVAS